MSQTIHSRSAAAQSTAGSLLFVRGRSARLIDALLMGLVIMRIDMPGFPADVPLAQIALIVLLFLAGFRRPTRSLRRVLWYPILVVLMLTYLTTVSIIQDVEFVRRLGNLAILVTVAGFMASGRIDVVSGLKGIGAALVLNVGLFYAGLAPDEYGGVLTGFLADKNAAGLVYGIGALLCSLTTQKVWLRILILTAGAGALVLTDSRTSMAAYAVAAVWLTLAPRCNMLFRALLGGGLTLAFFWADTNLSDIGSYAVTREGSDALRDRIDDAATAKVADTPWYGGGLGEAVTEVDDRTWFFHNAYHGLLAEGGVITLVLVIALYAIVGFGFLHRDRRAYATTVIGSATLFLLLTATRLGEVFFAPIGLILLGVGLALIVEHDRYTTDWRLLPRGIRDRR